MNLLRVDVAMTEVTVAPEFMAHQFFFEINTGTMAKRASQFSILFLTVLGTTLAGCGQPTTHRKAIYGTIAGAEGRMGLISFLPESEGPATRAKVTDGEYSFDELNGPVPGNHRVVVQLERPWIASAGTVLVKDVPVPVARAATLGSDYERRSLDISVPSAGSLRLNLQLPKSSEPMPADD